MINRSFYFTPHFLAKYYLLRDITRVTNTHSFSGKILDIGCGQKPYKALFPHASAYEGIDFPEYSKNKGYNGEKPDYFFTKQYLKTLTLPFPNNSFDHVVSFQVLEHHPEPEKLIAEASRVVKKHGLLFFTAPFIWGIHEAPHDYLRYTEYGLRHLFIKSHCRILSLTKHGSIFSVVTTLLLEYLIELAHKHWLLYLLCLVLYPLLLLCSYVCIVLDKVFRSDCVVLNYVLVAQKE